MVRVVLDFGVPLGEATEVWERCIVGWHMGTHPYCSGKFAETFCEVIIIFDTIVRYPVHAGVCTVQGVTGDRHAASDHPTVTPCRAAAY